MPRLKEFSQCRVSMYPRDHRPAHVHVEFRDGDRCTVEIASLRVVGTIRPASKMAEALDWIAANRETLMAQWEEIVR
ncbi:MAG: DUF4160 domain-containing protein [Gammaproteobacteria bacterium]|jgi:hypothetical protein|nr:DUF4160 domain-containing protein [Gammaproteobacteria bacterium]MBK8990218.1 DUF4160 domain-containing protein [Gammaproteobacteria bacterium]MBK9469225.1 DUF4160 domain-containing protein [Gammaproteobacteria bacterium]MBP6481932.1 DUF4160 domain-containing protein [Pseudomonadales bacterium]